MKKWYCIFLALMVFTFLNQDVFADSDYENYQEIQIYEGKFLSNYSKKDYDSYYKKVTKRKFAGWNIYKVTEDAPVSYKAETLFSYYNDGTTPIEYTYEYEKKETSNINITSTGSISVSVSGPIKKFKGGLDSSLKINYEDKSSSSEKETWKLKMQIDPGTMANLYTYGEGKISNGVAARYLFWFLSERGGYEVFTVTTQYYRLEKVKI